MHRRLLIACAIVALVVPAAVANAAHDSGWVVAGSATVDHGGGVVSEWTVNAVGSPAGRTATGTFRVHIYGADFDIDLSAAVDCLDVVDSTAYLSGVITGSNRSDIPAGTTFFTSMVDGSATATPDVVGPTYLSPGFTCLNPVSPEFAVTSGGVTILSCSKLKASGKCKVDAAGD